MKSYQKIYNSIGVLAGTTTLAIAGKANAAAGRANTKGFLDKFRVTAVPSSDLSSGTKDADTTMNAIVSKVVDYLLAIGGMLAFVFLVWNGIRYITSNGDSKKAETARAGIINSIIGIVIIVAAYSIIRFGLGLGNVVSNTVGGNSNQ